MTDAPPPPPGFNWNLPPKKPDDAEPELAAPPPGYAPPPPPPAPPPWPGAQQGPPAYAPPTQSGPQFPTGSFGVAPPTAQQPVAPPPPFQPPQPYQPYQPYQAPQPLQPHQPPQQSYQPPTQHTPVPPQQPPVVAHPYEDVATQAYSFDPPTTQSYPFDDSFRGATEVLGAQPVGLPELRDEGLRPHAPASAIDALFGESQFREYEAGVLPTDAFAASTQLRERVPREPMGKPQKVLLWVAGGLLASLALVGLFMVGTKLSALIPEPVAEPTPTGEPVVVVAKPPVVGPVAPGVYAWDALLGGECIDPFVSAWQEEYTVVDCSAPHAAQLVSHGYFSDEAYAPYPGEAALASRINLLCTSPASVNYSVASKFDDIQVAASYAVSEAEWAAGQRDFYCFVSRSTAEPFTASVATEVVASQTLIPTVPGNDP